jgi:hypothetical protein
MALALDQLQADADIKSAGDTGKNAQRCGCALRIEQPRYYGTAGVHLTC